jgi:hypothetical protein
MAESGGFMRAARLGNETVADPINRALIEALWHSSVPLSAALYVGDYTGNAGSSAYVDVISAHLAALEAASVVKVDHVEAGGDAFYVLGGDNAGEAVRRLELAQGRLP